MKRIIRKTWRTLAARPAFQKINQLMFDCSLRGLGILNYENNKVSGEQHFIEKVLPLYMLETPILFVDVGANCGDYINLLKEFHPNASVLAFEPNPKTYQILEKKFNDSDVTVVNKGLGSIESVLKFYDRKDHDGSSAHGSLYRKVIEEIHKIEVVEMEIDITTFDAYLEENGIQKVTFLKIDTEGHELEVLKGAHRILENGNVDLLQIEFNEMNIVSRVFFRDIAESLTNYIPYRLLPTGAIRLKRNPLRTELFAFQNIVFVNKRFKPNKAMKPTAQEASSSLS